MFISRYEIEDYINEADASVLIKRDSDLENAQNSAIELVKTSIQHRYDEALVFFDILDFDTTTTYAEDDNIRYTEDEYVAATTYSTDDRISYDGYIYKSLQDNNTGNTPDTATSYWEEVADDNSYYTAVQASTGNYPENTTYFTQIDSRNSLIVDFVLTLTIYNLFRKSQPSNIPDWITVERDNAMTELDKIGLGKKTLILPVALDDDEDQEGHAITYGSQTQRDLLY